MIRRKAIVCCFDLALICHDMIVLMVVTER